MKFLIDQRIISAGGKNTVRCRICDAIHDAADIEIFGYAGDNDRIVVSADTDFGTLLALWQKPKPSVVLFRRVSQRHPQQQAALLLANLRPVEKALEKGSIVVIEEKRLRIRNLPISN